MHFLSADQIGHHLVFETHQGKTRVFQCSVKARVTITDGTEHVVGCERALHACGAIASRAVHVLCRRMECERRRRFLGPCPQGSSFALGRWARTWSLVFACFAGLALPVASLGRRSCRKHACPSAAGGATGELARARTHAHTTPQTSVMLYAFGTCHLTRFEGRSPPPSPKACNYDVDRCHLLAARCFEPQRCSLLTAIKQSPSSTTPPGRRLMTDLTAL